ncbi:MAG: hypothetical protein JST47_16085 [Bacteroidetes bacterium]|nr:hypothetical protein [Bacteroidota bacterium]MBS1973510.1 hypothetical protein [Bacteroidota bacterium]
MFPVNKYFDRIKRIEGNEISVGNLKVQISQNYYNDIIKAILQDRMIKR